MGLIFFLQPYGCKKSFLDAKPSTNLNVPSTIEDLQMLLDNTFVINNSPGLGEVSSDDYYITYEAWNDLLSLNSPKFYNAYVWNRDIFNGGGEIPSWNNSYQEALYANIVLKQIQEIDKTEFNQMAWNNLKGSALFLRAWSFFHLAQVFAMPYDAHTADLDLGIPLKLSAEINEKVVRATTKETYNRILIDATEAVTLLNSNVLTANINRPNKPAAYAFLSRVYLTMRNYPKAKNYADSALRLHNKLIDFNEVSQTSDRPFGISNAEALFQHNVMDDYTVNNVSLAVNGYSVDSLLYRTYTDNDLRKSVFFTLNGKYIVKKRGYSGSAIISNGLFTDELYLTRAECYARTGDISNAINDLNTLLVKRWSTGTFVPLKGTDPVETLNKILLERRKELLFRGMRWMDIRRLNKEGSNITLTRSLNGKTYNLPPNDPRYALPIPSDVIALSGIEQNKR